MPDEAEETANNLSPEDRAWIDNASLESLLHRNRFAPLGDDWFHGQRGRYHLDVMYKKRDADPAEWTAASKRIGW